MLLAPESSEYEGYTKSMELLMVLIDRGLGEQQILRPDSSWLVILMKELFYWLEDFGYFPPHWLDEI